LKKYKVATILLIASIGTMFLTNAFAANTAGGKCTKAGQTVTAKGQKLTCSLIWVASGPVAPSVTPSKSPADSNSIQSKSFRLDSISFNSDLGSAGATARVTNTSKNTRTATLNVSIFASDGKTVAVSMFGVVNAVGPGQTVTVTFMSVSGDLPNGKFKYSFQVDAEF
jgi:hypothetical protein